MVYVDPEKQYTERDWERAKMLGNVSLANAIFFDLERQKQEKVDLKCRAERDKTKAVISLKSGKAVYREHYDALNGWHSFFWISSDCFENFDEVKKMHEEVVGFLVEKLENENAENVGEPRVSKQIQRMVNAFNSEYAENIMYKFEKWRPFFDGFMPDHAYNANLWLRLPKKLTTDDILSASKAKKQAKEGLEIEK